MNDIIKKKTPPPFKIEKRNSKFLSKYSYILCIALILIIIIIGFNKGCNNQSLDYNDLLMQINNIEKTRPDEFIIAGGKALKNAGGNYNIYGELKSNARATTFKDIVIEFTFLSSTDAILGKDTLIIYRKLKPNENETFYDMVINPYDETRKVKWNVVNALPLQDTLIVNP